MALSLELAITHVVAPPAQDRLESALILSTIFALAVAFCLSAGAANSIGARLNNISRFSVRIASGDITARVSDWSADEIGKLASRFDEMARGLEARFTELRTSSRQLETLLSSMQDAVIAVSREGKGESTNRRLGRLVGQAARLDAPVV